MIKKNITLKILSSYKTVYFGMLLHSTSTFPLCVMNPNNTWYFLFNQELCIHILFDHIQGKTMIQQKVMNHIHQEALVFIIMV